MIFNNENKQKAGINDWHAYYSADVVTRLNMAVDGDFLFCGQKAEPQRKWSKESKSYDDEVTGYGYWVCQNYVDEETGQLYQQNPILVVIDGYDRKLNFGDRLRFDGLAGYYSRKKRSYSFRADSVEAIK